MKILVIIIGAALAVSAIGNVFLHNTNIVVVNEKNSYATTMEQLNTDYNIVVAERERLKGNIDTLVF